MEIEYLLVLSGCQQMSSFPKHEQHRCFRFSISHSFSLVTGDGKCVICDSYVRPCTLVRICDECNYGSYQGRCVICGGPGVSDAYYCKECTIQEKDVSF